LWRDLRTRRINPLHGWAPCRCGDEIRLNYPVVTEVVLDAIARREARETSNSQKAVYQCLRRLREALGGLGCSKEVLANDLLIERLDEWLLHHCHGRRTHSAYARALQHAASDGWFVKRR
jgi:Lhr-like helicase